MAWAWNLCVGFLLVLLWSRLLPLALVLVSCVKLIEFSPVPFFGCSSVSYCCSDSSRSVFWFSGTVCVVTLLSGLVILVGSVSM
ncbi:hypothetical protein Bca4012_093591 [Brassica carinata]